MFFKTFAGSIGLTVVGLVIALIYAGPTGLAIAAILGVLEISLSFDNAVVNAGILKTMNPFWQKIFLTVGILIAVIGMRLAFPLIIVGITAKLSPAEAIRLALDKGDPKTPGSYCYLLHAAHPAIAAFGGVFLLMLFLDFILEEREITWLGWLERPLARIGKLDQLSVVVSLIAVSLAAYRFAPHGKISTVLLSGVLGLVSYVLVNGLGELFEAGEEELIADVEPADRAEPVVAPGPAGRGGNSTLLLKAGKAAFFSFLYL